MKIITTAKVIEEVEEEDIITITGVKTEVITSIQERTNLEVGAAIKIGREGIMIETEDSTNSMR